LKNEILDFHIKANKKEIIHNTKETGVKFLLKSITTSPDKSKDNGNIKKAILIKNKSKNAISNSIQKKAININNNNNHYHLTIDTIDSENTNQGFSNLTNTNYKYGE
jgi:hypothetical protein